MGPDIPGRIAGLRRQLTTKPLPDFKRFSAPVANLLVAERQSGFQALAELFYLVLDGEPREPLQRQGGEDLDPGFNRPEHVGE